MKKELQAICLMLALILWGPAFGQTKTFSEFQSDFDDHESGSFSFERWNNKADYVIGPLMHVDISDMYWEAFALVNGYRLAWMASGDSRYLDFVLDVVQRDIENATNMSTANPGPQLATYRTWNYNAFLAQPNYFGFSGNVSIAQYINQVPNPLTQGYGRRTNVNGAGPGTYIALDEGMYNRNIAQLARVMHNNIDVIGDQVSNNGQTYRQRLDVLIDHLKNHVWARNFENPNVDASHWNRDIYRVNVHMSSHLAMVALCLYVIEGDQKYLDLVEEFLWDFDSNPNSTTSYIPSGEGFLDKLVLQPEGYYMYVAPWGKDIGEHVIQDAGHAVAEFQLVKACYEEGIGLNPPAGDLPVDDILIQRLTESIRYGLLKEYTCAIGPNEQAVAFRFDQSGLSYGLQSTLASFAEYSDDILCYLEQRTSGIDLQRIGVLGAAMYASRVRGVGGDPGPAFTATGSGVAPSNNRPQVNSLKGNRVELIINDIYNEEGAVWNDVEDGSGSILTPTSGSVPVDGSNRVTTAGTYVLEYSYTDSGGLTGTATLTVEVSNGTSFKPVLNLSASSITIAQFGEYVAPTYSWSDAQDGGPFTTGAVIGGDTVDTSVLGVYTISYTVTNSLGLTDTDFVTVRVVEFTPDQVSSLYWLSPSKFIMSLNSTDMPEFIVRPFGSFVVTTDDNTIIEVQELNENVFQLLAVGVGTANVTVSTTDGSNLSITKQVEVKTRKKIIPRILQN